MNTTPVTTPYGIIYYRDALIITSQTIVLSPLSATITCSLSLSSCIPEIRNVQYKNISFEFTKIKSKFIYGLDDYPYEKYSSSSFDKVEDSEDRYILSTYDHVFDVTGEFKIIEH